MKIAVVVLSTLLVVSSGPATALTITEAISPLQAAHRAHAELVRLCLARPKWDRLRCHAQVVEPFDAAVEKLLNASGN